MSSLWISLDSLGPIRGSLTPYTSWPSHPLSHVGGSLDELIRTGWTVSMVTVPWTISHCRNYPCALSLPGSRPLSLANLWFYRHPGITGSDLFAERCVLRQTRKVIIMQRVHLCRGELLWLHAGKYGRLLIGRDREYTATQWELKTVPHLFFELWSYFTLATNSTNLNQFFADDFNQMSFIHV